MRAGEAIEIARQMIAELVGDHAEIEAAFLHGSVTWLTTETELAPTSDIDVMVVTRDPATLAGTTGKRVVHGLVLDVSALAWAEIESAGRVLGAYHLASSMRNASAILFDRDGRLRAVQTGVGAGFADPIWIGLRCDHVTARITWYLDSVSGATAPEQWAMSWLFGCGVTTHLYLVAGLRNPTVRNRYPLVRAMLGELEQDALFPPLLDLLNPDETSADDVRSDLDFLESLFDATLAAKRSPFPYANDISTSGRIGAIDANRELIAQRAHREALFWIGVTATRCMTMLAVDAPETYAAAVERYLVLLGRFDIANIEAATRRTGDVRRAIPTLRAEADLIMQVALARPGWLR